MFLLGTATLLVCSYFSVSYIHLLAYLLGLLFDRVYMLADKSLNYKFISQRKYPLMALITTSIDLVAGILYVNAPGMYFLLSFF